MKKFVVTYHAPAEALAQSMKASKEDMQKGMEAWMVWAKKCGEGLADMGTPLMGGTKLNPDGSSQASQAGVCGYSVLNAENMEAAKALMDGHPHLNWTAGCEIEIHESMPLPGEEEC